MRFEMKLEGTRELDSLLARLPERLEKRVMQNAVSGAARVAARDIRKAAPRGEPPRSAASERYKPLHKNIRVRAIRGIKAPGVKGARISTGDAFWGLFYELGTRFQPARPWFGPAFDGARNKALSELIVRIRKGVHKEVQKLKKR